MSEPDPKMMFVDPVGPWGWWFAWFPVRTYDKRLVWLRWVRRRPMRFKSKMFNYSDYSWQHHAATLPAKEGTGQ